MVLFFLNLGGAVALLLWSIHLIRSAIEQAFKPQLRASLQRVSRNPLLTLATGGFSAMALQSASAVAMLTVSFVASGALSSFHGVILILGADLGSAIATLILASQPEFVIPLLILAGVICFKQESRGLLAQVGQALIGLGLTLFALQMIRLAAAPLGNSVIVGEIMAYFSNDHFSAFLIGALLAWLMHSSVATILTVATFASTGLVANQTLVMLVLGANLGGAIIPLYLTLSNTGSERIILWVNLVLRGGLAILAALVASRLAPSAFEVAGNITYVAIALHVLFNFVTAIACIPFVNFAIKSLSCLVTGKPDTDLLAHTNLIGPFPEDPNRALANTNREVLHMAEHVYAMFRSAGEIFDTWDATEVDEIDRREELVDRMHFDIKLFVAQILEMELNGDQRNRALGLVATADSLEIVGDLVSRDLVAISRRLKTDGLQFSLEGKNEIADLHQRVSANAQLALDALMHPDPSVARKLAREKRRLRNMERMLQERHLDRLRAGKTQSIETSNMHQTTLHTMKQVNTGFWTIAQRILENVEKDEERKIQLEADVPAE